MENDGNFVILLLWVINFDKVSLLVEITKKLGGGGGEARPFGPSPRTALWKKCDLRQPFWLKVLHNLDASVKRIVLLRFIPSLLH